MRPGLTALLLGLMLAVTWTAGAMAHAVLLAAEPADGSILATVPPSVTLRFSEAITVGALTLVDARGRRRDDVRIEAAEQTVVMTLPSDLPRGSQLVSYRVISADGHPVAGVISFAVGAPTAGAASVERDRWRDGLIWLTRLGLYVGLLFGVGGAFFLSWLGPAKPARRIVFVALGVGLGAAGLSIGLQGLDLLGLGIGSLATTEPWIAGAATTLMRTISVSVAAMVGAVAAMQAGRSEVGRGLAALALAGVGLALMLSGHAAIAPPHWLSRSAMVLHGVGAAFWLGALVPLAALVFTSDARAGLLLKRFSVIALPVVAVLALAGTALALLELPSLNAMVETSYGRLLSLKLALVVVLLGLAGLNRFRLVAAFAADARSRALGRSILLECILGAAILAVVAGWRFTPPPRDIVPDTPLGLHIHGERAMFQVLVSPGRVGLDNFLLQLMNADGMRLQATEATLTLQLPAAGIGPIERKAARGADGDWHVRDVPLPLPGRWHLRIDALVSDFDQITLEDEFEIGPR